MNELREVVEMVTKQAEPSRDSWTEQERRQQRAARNRKIGAIGLAAAMIVVAVVFAVTNLGNGKDGALVPTPADTGQQLPPGSGPLGLAIVGLDGTVLQDLGLPTDAWMPDLSADGTKVMFITRSHEVGFCGGCTPDYDRVAIVPLGDASGKFIYLDPGLHIDQIEEPVWSPDGSQIAFVGLSREDGNRDIYVADLRYDNNALISGAGRRLTSDPGVDEFPAWSPDGSTIFYDNGGAEPLDDSGFSITQEIWSVSVDGGVPQRLTNNKVADAMPDVAADGTVAFWRAGEIWTMDRQGGNQERLKAVPGETGFNPRWSPDGSMMALLRFDPASVVYISDLHGRPEGMPTLEVVVVDLATGEVTTVGPRVAADFNPVSWMPDGSGLLINRYDAGP
jgi:Tol biopolymer transport system component